MKFLFPSAAFPFLTIPAVVLAHSHHNIHSHHHGEDDASNLRGARTLAANENAPGWVVDLTSDTKFKDPKGNWKDGVRCGAPHKKEDSIGDDRKLQEVMEAGHVDGRKLSAGAIRTAVHVMCKDNGSDCSATQKMVNNQMVVLNDGFEGTGYSFDLVETTFNNNSVYQTVGYGSSTEGNMKRALAIEPATTFNVYVGNLGGGLLGWATFPNMYDESNPLHGVVLLGATLPGGTASPYDLGATLTHEAGHYLGLYHTFQGGCRGDGDKVSDTPAERQPAYECKIGRDSCKSSSGSDPVTNFMDYSDDACMNEFTDGQRLRMMAEVGLWKPSLIASSPPTCNDGIQNQDEEGIDCGGPCAACPPPPTPTCSDGIQNQNETGIDCGGPCTACPTLPAPTCSDGIQNQDETGIDCGGPCSACPTPPACGQAGAACETNSDCCFKCKNKQKVCM